MLNVLLAFIAVVLDLALILCIMFDTPFNHLPIPPLEVVTLAFDFFILGLLPDVFTVHT